MKKLLVIMMLLFLAHPATAQQNNDAAITRGAYIARLGDCTACHTAPGGKPFAGGLPMYSPFGMIYATNITPDKDYGIGAYTYDDFARALRHGIAQDGRHLYPAMPYANFAAVSDDDMHDMYAYFMHGVAPVAMAVPETKLPFPLNQRWGLAIWDWLFARGQVYQPDNKRDAAWNRGAYLVEGLGHCGACHTPRTVFYNEEGHGHHAPAFLGGYTIDNWHAPDLRGDRAYGLGRWQEDDIVAFLKTGHNAGVTAYGAMQQVVEESTQYFSPADLHSVAHYLKSLTATGQDESALGGQPALKSSAAYPMEHPGAGLYQGLCARCHGPAGEGGPPFYPALNGNPIVLSKDPTSLIHIVLEGGATPRTRAAPNSLMMPSFANLTDREIGEVLSYIRADWRNHAQPVSMRAVTKLRHDLIKNNREKQQALQQSQHTPD